MFADKVNPCGPVGTSEKLENDPRNAVRESTKLLLLCPQLSSALFKPVGTAPYGRLEQNPNSGRPNSPPSEHEENRPEVGGSRAKRSKVYLFAGLHLIGMVELSKHARNPNIVSFFKTAEPYSVEMAIGDVDSNLGCTVLTLALQNEVSASFIPVLHGDVPPSPYQAPFVALSVRGSDTEREGIRLAWRSTKHLGSHGLEPGEAVFMTDDSPNLETIPPLDRRPTRQEDVNTGGTVLEGRNIGLRECESTPPSGDSTGNRYGVPSPVGRSVSIGVEPNLGDGLGRTRAKAIVSKEGIRV